MVPVPTALGALDKEHVFHPKPDAHIVDTALFARNGCTHRYRGVEEKTRFRSVTPVLVLSCAPLAAVERFAVGAIAKWLADDYPYKTVFAILDSSPQKEWGAAAPGPRSRAPKNHSPR